MQTNMIDKKLISLSACKDAREWAKGKSWKEIFDTCHRGDWLLWLYKKTRPDDLQRLTLAKGHCANTVRHFMKDERSTKAVDAAIAFGEGQISWEELRRAAAAADVSFWLFSIACLRSAAAADICRQYLPFEIWNLK